MSTGVSPALIHLAVRAPRTSRFLLWLLSRRIRQPHWVLCRIASALDYFPIVDAHLGNSMRIRVFWGQIVGTGILVNGYHEMHTVRVVQQLLKPGMVFMDCRSQRRSVHSVGFGPCRDPRQCPQL